jgi:ribosomal protein L31
MGGYPFNRHLECPWCHGSEIIADRKVKASISVQCSKCHKFYIGDLDTLKTERSNACKRLGRNK